MTGTVRAAQPDTGGRAVATILTGLMLGMFLGALDTMIMASALRTVADQLQGLTLQAWVSTAYLVTLTISAPLYGKLSDIYGRKRLYLIAIVLFLAGSPEILGIAGWRWIFFINVPIGLVAGLLVVLLLKVSAKGARQRVDYGGAITLAITVLPLLVVAENGRHWGWGAPLSIALYALGGVGLVAFLLVERRVGDSALLPAKLFRNLSFTLVNMVNFLGGLGVFAGLALFPLYLQIVKGLSPVAAGLLLLPQSLATTLGARNSSPLMNRFGYKTVLAGGMTLMTLVYLLLGWVGVATPVFVLGVLVTVLGYGMGVFFQVILIAIQDSVPASDIGLASGLYSFTRQIGGVAGTAVFVSLLFGVADDRVGDSFRAASEQDPLSTALRDPQVLAVPANAKLVGEIQATGTVGLDDTSFLAQVDGRLAQPILEGLASSLNLVFIVVGAFLALSVILALSVKGKAGSEEETPC
ncbi:MFS transporter [Amycolatopsis sp. cmx-11-32]|uniref:MFS transporter n=1 Tax=Amycolatopsis sp. cmx-11-32 TaxID=2785796 RepID=UPI0039E5ADA5